MASIVERSDELHNAQPVVERFKSVNAWPVAPAADPAPRFSQVSRTRARSSFDTFPEGNPASSRRPSSRAELRLRMRSVTTNAHRCLQDSVGCLRADRERHALSGVAHLGAVQSRAESASRGSGGVGSRGVLRSGGSARWRLPRACARGPGHRVLVQASSVERIVATRAHDDASLERTGRLARRIGRSEAAAQSHRKSQ